MDLYLYTHEHTYYNLLQTAKLSSNATPPYVPAAEVQWTSLVLEVNGK